MSTSPPPGAWPPQPGPPDPREPTWDRLFAPDDGGWDQPRARPPMGSRPSGGSNRPLIVGVAVTVVVVVAIGLVVWLVRPSSVTPSPEGVAGMAVPQYTSPRPRAPSEAEARLAKMLPPGYASDACTPRTPGPVAVAVAEMTCARNGDAGGPTAATYSLFRDEAAMSKAFGEVIRTSMTVECPGRIQSPGTWRRSPTTPQVSGTLFCGLQQNRPTVAWTDDAPLLLSVVRGGPREPTLPQLYTWWSSHS